MFAFVSKTRIAPRRASEFVYTFLSSDFIANRTRIFLIGENDWSEKTCNVSFMVEISAFNQNHSVYKSMTHHKRTHPEWRWRRSEHRFNLSILLAPAYEVAWRSSRILCFDGQRRILTVRENCEKMVSDNITIDTIGQIAIELGN